MLQQLKDRARKYAPQWTILVWRFLYWTFKQDRWKYVFEPVYVDRHSHIVDLLRECWTNFRRDIYPNDRRLSVLEQNHVRGMSTENICFLINEIVKRFASKGTYLEVGTFNGCSLLSAALYNTSTRCIGIDNFSAYGHIANNEDILKTNLEKFDNLQHVQFYNMDYIKALQLLFSKEPDLKVNVYFYDGEHSYENQVRGLEILLLYLAEKCVILVDDFWFRSAEKANEEFLQRNPSFKSVFRIRPNPWKASPSETWWNGLEIMTRGI